MQQNETIEKLGQWPNYWEGKWKIGSMKNAKGFWLEPNLQFTKNSNHPARAYEQIKTAQLGKMRNIKMSIMICGKFLQSSICSTVYLIEKQRELILKLRMFCSKELHKGENTALDSYWENEKASRFVGWHLCLPIRPI